MEDRHIDRISLGKKGEEAAVRYLAKRKYKILARGFRMFRGEIDIIAFHHRTLVFCEVKTRRSRRYGFPEEAVTEAKQDQIRKIAQGYLVKNRLAAALCQFDVLSVVVDENGRAEIEHIEDAF
jgi:putative endonuclease